MPPPYYLEVLFCGGMTCVTAMIMYGEGSFRCSLNLKSFLDGGLIYLSGGEFFQEPVWIIVPAQDVGLV